MNSDFAAFSAAAAIRAAKPCRSAGNFRHGRVDPSGDMARVLHCHSVDDEFISTAAFAPDGVDTPNRKRSKGYRTLLRMFVGHHESRIAGLLTQAASLRRNLGGFLPRRAVQNGLRRYPAIIVAGVLWAVSSPARAESWQDNAEIARVAEDYVAQHAGKRDSRVKPQAGYLDSRFKLSRCDVELEGFLRPGTSITSRTVVGVRCSGTRPWKVYVPVDVVVTDAVLVTRKTLPRGHILTAGDLVPDQRNVSRLVGGYIVDPTEILGQRLKHRIMGGQVVTRSMLVADTVIKRGQSVTLILENGGLNITMGGKALMDGAINQRIRVENTASRRIVEGLVRSPEHVEILVN